MVSCAYALATREAGKNKPGTVSFLRERGSATRDYLCGWVGGERIDAKIVINICLKGLTYFKPSIITMLFADLLLTKYSQANDLNP